jgi:hypothetical protein
MNLLKACIIKKYRNSYPTTGVQTLKFLAINVEMILSEIGE